MEKGEEFLSCSLAVLERFTEIPGKQHIITESMQIDISKQMYVSWKTAVLIEEAVIIN